MKQSEKNPDVEFRKIDFDFGWSEQIVMTNKDMMIFDHSIYQEETGNKETTICVWHSECAKVVEL